MDFLLIGPLNKPATGNGLVNQFIIDNLSNYVSEIKIDFIDTNYLKFDTKLGQFNLGKFFYYVKQYKYLYKIFNSSVVYLTVGQTFFGVLKYAPYVFLSVLLKKKIIIHIHGDGLWQEYRDVSFIKKKILKIILSKIDKGIVLSHTLKRNLIPFVELDKICVLYNFVDERLFNFNINAKINRESSELRIVFLSNLIPSKGIFVLLDAVKLLYDVGQKFSLKIGGLLDDANKNKFYSKLSLLKDNVKYLGPLDFDRKKELFIWSNIFVLPTFYRIEGQPLSILEAYATGNIVITTDQGGILDIFENNHNGKLVKKEDSADLFEKIISISVKDQFYKNIALNNHFSAKDNYSEEIFIKNFLKIITNIKEE